MVIDFVLLFETSMLSKVLAGEGMVVKMVYGVRVRKMFGVVVASVAVLAL